MILIIEYIRLYHLFLEVQFAPKYSLCINVLFEHHDMRINHILPLILSNRAALHGCEYLN